MTHARSRAHIACGLLLAFGVCIPKSIRAQEARVRDTHALATSAPSTRPTYSVELSLAAAHLTTVDQALSLERYGGSGLAVGVRLARLTVRRRIGIAAGVASSSALTIPRSGGGLPDVQYVAADGRLDLQQHLRALDFGRVVTYAGIALDGRYAERTHRVKSPPGGPSSPPENRGQDLILSLQPTIELTRPLGAGVMAYRLGVSAVGAVSHAWAPVGSLDRQARVQVPPGLLMVDNLATAERPLGRRATIGIEYRLRLLRVRSSNDLAESRHDLALTLAWRRGSAP